MNITIMQRILRRMAFMIACFGAASLATQAATTTVVFNNFSFVPKSVTIQAGDTVVWNNAGGSHTVTGDGADPFCGTGAIPVSCSVTFPNAGSFSYHCVFHQSF